MPMVPVHGLRRGDNALGPTPAGTAAKSATSELTVDTLVADLEAGIVHATIAGKERVVVVHGHDDAHGLARSHLVLVGSFYRRGREVVVDVVEVNHIWLELIEKLAQGAGIIGRVDRPTDILHFGQALGPAELNGGCVHPTLVTKLPILGIHAKKLNVDTAFGEDAAKVVQVGLHTTTALQKLAYKQHTHLLSSLIQI